jgi:hypothetical protein
MADFSTEGKTRNLAVTGIGRFLCKVDTDIYQALEKLFQRTTKSEQSTYLYFPPIPIRPGGMPRISPVEQYLVGTRG